MGTVEVISLNPSSDPVPICMEDLPDIQDISPVSTIVGALGTTFGKLPCCQVSRSRILIRDKKILALASHQAELIGRFIGFDASMMYRALLKGGG